MLLRRTFFPTVIVAAAAFASTAAGQIAPAAPIVPTTIQLEEVLLGLDFPIAFGFLPDGRILVVEQFSGKVIVRTPHGLQAQIGTFSPLNAVDFLRGVQGMTIDPGWPARPFVYLSYTHPVPQTCRIAMCAVSGDLTNPLSTNLTLGAPYVVIDDMPDATINHNVGALRFGPDGMLYVAVGDDQDDCSAQNLNALKGKILRLDVSTLPGPGAGPPPKSQIAAAGNPFQGIGANAALVWAYGLRNPFRMSFDSLTGDLFIADVGADDWEEIDLCNAPGMNFGWPNVEGFVPSSASCQPGAAPPTPPILAIPHPNSTAIVSLGCYRNPPGAPLALGGAYEGDYFFADYFYGTILRARFDGSAWIYVQEPTHAWSPGLFAIGVYTLTDAAVGPDGALYFLQHALGTIGRFRPAPLRLGNGADAAIEVSRNGVVDLTPDNTHVLNAGDTLGLRFYSPAGSLMNEPFLAAYDFVVPQTTARQATLIPGDFEPAVWVSVPGFIVLADGISQAGQAQAPTLAPGGYGLGPFLVPQAFAGANASIMVQIFMGDFGNNAFDLGASDPHELILPP